MTGNWVDTNDVDNVAADEEEEDAALDDASDDVDDARDEDETTPFDTVGASTVGADVAESFWIDPVTATTARPVSRSVFVVDE